MQNNTAEITQLKTDLTEARKLAESRDRDRLEAIKLLDRAKLDNEQLDSI